MIKEFCDICGKNITDDYYSYKLFLTERKSGYGDIDEKIPMICGKCATKIHDTIVELGKGK